MDEDEHDSDTRVELAYLIAAVIHEGCRALANQDRPDGSPAPEGERIPHWTQAPKWMKVSSRNAVVLLWENEDMTPEDVHLAWVNERLKGGWVWGPERDVDRKTNPALVPYDELPANQRTKDELIHSMVMAAKATLTTNPRRLH